MKSLGPFKLNYDVKKPLKQAPSCISNGPACAAEGWYPLFFSFVNLFTK